MSFYLQIGGNSYPLDPDQATYSINEVSDTLKLNLLECFKVAIETETQDVWNKISDGYSELTVIGESVPFSVLQHITLGVMLSFPVLSLCREKSQTFRHTEGTWLEKQTWKLLYVMPPLNPLLVGRLEGIRNAVKQVVWGVLSQARYPGFNDGYSLSTLGLVGISDEVKSEFGEWEMVDSDSLVYCPTVVITFDTFEQINLANVPSVPFAGTDATISNESVGLADLKMDV